MLNVDISKEDKYPVENAKATFEKNSSILKINELNSRCSFSCKYMDLETDFADVKLFIKESTRVE